MTPQYFEDAIDLLDKEAKEVMVSKQRDYGPGNITAFGEFGVLVRLNDKVERLKNLLCNNKTPCNEAIEDTWLDIENYAKIARMLRRGIFVLPLADNAPSQTVGPDKDRGTHGDC